MNSSVIVFPGSNCDRDVAVALKKMQFKNKMVWHKETSLPKSDLIVIPGGFSYGDYLRSGAIAGKSSIIDETIVTTDSKKIFNIAKKFKSKVIIRPIYLGKDNINANQVIAHAIKKNNLHEEYIIVYLQPTSPFRNHKHINKAFNILKNYKTYNLVY